MKKLLAVLLTAMIAASTLVSCSSIGEYTFTQTNSALEAGEDYDLSDCVELQDGFTYEITEDNINIHELGSYPVTFTISDEEGHTAKETLQFEVVDTEPPVFGGETNITIDEGDDFNLLNYVSASDNYDGDVSNLIKYDDSTFDVEIPGHYSVSLSVSDSNGNEISKTISVDVQKVITPRENTVIRNVCWRDDLQTVKDNEENAPDEEALTDNDINEFYSLGYNDVPVVGIDTQLVYNIDLEYGLYYCGYIYQAETLTNDLIFSNYQTLLDALITKYGDPEESQRYNGFEDWEPRLSLAVGALVYSDKWYLENVNIDIVLGNVGGSGYIIISYRDPNFESNTLSDNL